MKLKVLKKDNNSSECVVCGIHNPLSLNTHFYECEGEVLVGLVTGQDIHQSYPNRMHGGIITALLDETIGRAINVYEPDTFGVTASLEIKFRKPVPLNQEIKVVGKIIKNTSRIFTASGFIEDKDGVILATASATYVKQDINIISKKEFGEEDWFLLPDEKEFIEIKNSDYFEEKKPS